MLKGAEKRILVVKNPDKKYFEQAIFVMRSDAFRKSAKSEREIMEEARAAAESFIKINVNSKEKIIFPKP